MDDLERTPWYRFRRRQELRDRLGSLDEQWAALAPDVADTELMVEFFQQRQKDSQRNPAHPEVLSALEQYSADAARAAAGREVPRVDGWWDDETWSAFPEVAALMTPARAGTLIQELVKERAAVTADHVYLYRRFTKDGQPAVRVQHRASGLRADFWTMDHGENIGRIYAKPYNLGSIDPEDDNPESGYVAWYTYGGLGIGRRVFEVGATLVPDVRWGREFSAERSDWCPCGAARSGPLPVEFRRMRVLQRTEPPERTAHRVVALGRPGRHRVRRPSQNRPVVPGRRRAGRRRR